MGGKLWLKNMKVVIQKNFKKIRLNGKNRITEEIIALFEHRNSLENGTTEWTENDKLIAEKIYKKIDRK